MHTGGGCQFSPKIPKSVPRSMNGPRTKHDTNRAVSMHNAGKKLLTFVDGDIEFGTPLPQNGDYRRN